MKKLNIKAFEYTSSKSKNYGFVLLLRLNLVRWFPPDIIHELVCVATLAAVVVFLLPRL